MIIDTDSNRAENNNSYKIKRINKKNILGKS